MCDATDISSIKFNKDDIDEHMFTKQQLWETAKRLTLENDILNKNTERLAESSKLLLQCYEEGITDLGIEHRTKQFLNIED